jgi:hypothetical protein
MTAAASTALRRLRAESIDIIRGGRNKEEGCF